MMTVNKSIFRALPVRPVTGALQLRLAVTQRQRRATGDRTRTARYLTQLSTQPIAIGNVQILQLFEPQQKRQRLRRVMTIG
jgi:hypothetical protein